MKWFKVIRNKYEYYKYPLLHIHIKNFIFDVNFVKYKPGILSVVKDTENSYSLDINLKGKSKFICMKTIFNNKFLLIFKPVYTHCLKVNTNSYKINVNLKINKKLEKI